MSTLIPLYLRRSVLQEVELLVQVALKLVLPLLEDLGSSLGPFALGVCGLLGPLDRGGHLRDLGVAVLPGVAVPDEDPESAVGLPRDKASLILMASATPALAMA